MIQQLISTSSPRCLNGNAGFGIVAQTAGMAPNIAQTVNTLSGYSHHFPAGDPRNPSVFLHALRRTGGVLRHIVSRISDSGNDYSGRTNRLAHHWIIEENDVRDLPCGPAGVASQPAFRGTWGGPSAELSPSHPFGKGIAVFTGVCATWREVTGDAGWAGVVAEHIENGGPISVIFSEDQKNLPLLLLHEVLALLPERLRWQTTFSTYFMKSQEPAGAGREERIQVKFFLDGTDEARYAKQTPNTLFIDLRNPHSLGALPASKYVEAARFERTATKMAGPPNPFGPVLPTENDAVASGELYGTASEDAGSLGLELIHGVPKKASRSLSVVERAKIQKKQRKNINPLYWIVPVAAVLVVLAGLTMWQLMARNAARIAQAERGQKQAPLEAAKEPEKEPKAPEEPPAKAPPQEVEMVKEPIEEQNALEKPPAEAEAPYEVEAIKKAADEEQRKKTLKELPGKIQAALGELPDVWKNLALTKKSSKEDNKDERTLDLATLLDLVKIEDIKFEYEAFVLLEKDRGFDAAKLTTEKKGPKIQFFRSGKPEPFASFDLEGKKYRFRWEKGALKADGERFVADHQIQEVNRILLGRLKITVRPDGIDLFKRIPPKIITLWEPVENTNNYSKIPTGEGEAFALWDQHVVTSMEGDDKPPEKKYLYHEDDGVSLLLTFDRVQIGEKEVEIKKEEFQPFGSPAKNRTTVAGFSPKFFFSGEEEPLLFTVSCDDAFQFDFKIRPDEKAGKIANLNQKIDTNQKESEQIDQWIKEGEAKMEGLKNSASNAPTSKEKQTLTKELENARNTFNIQKNSKEQEKNTLIRDKKTWEQEIKDYKNLVERTRFSIPAYEIYLLKSGTKPSDVSTEQNKLLLLRVYKKSKK